MRLNREQFDILAGLAESGGSPQQISLAEEKLRSIDSRTDREWLCL